MQNIKTPIIQQDVYLWGKITDGLFMTTKNEIFQTPKPLEKL